MAWRPLPEVLGKWDELLAHGRVVAVGGSDAHALRRHLGPIHRSIFPYDYHFRAINTHAFVPQPLTGEASADRAAIYQALAAGHCFVGYDLPHPTRGFHFTGHGREAAVIMGDEIPARGGVTLQARLPAQADLRLICGGRVIREARQAYAITHLAQEPGAYRVEAYRRYLGRKRGWIFSNPIYVR
jgi:hypothetical protein